MRIGYFLSGPDNDSHMYVDADGLSVCRECGYKTDYEYVNPNLVIKRACYDFSYTFDGCCIVSLAFREFCLRAKYSGLDFKKLPSDPRFYYLILRKQVEFDAAKRKTRFENFCETCGNYESITGATPVFLTENKSPLNSGFYRTNLQFASGNEKHPLVIVDVETFRVLKKNKITGIEAEVIYDDWFLRKKK